MRVVLWGIFTFRLLVFWQYEGNLQGNLVGNLRGNLRGSSMISLGTGEFRKQESEQSYCIL